MTKKNAIKLLEMQRDKLIDVSIYKDNIWVVQTTGFIKEIFGELSPEYNFISHFTFTVVHHFQPSNDVILTALKKKKEDALRFIDSCIETVNSKGFKLKKQNFLQNISNKELIGLIIPISGSIFMSGYFAGDYKAELKNDARINRIEVLEDSLIHFKSKQNSSIILSPDTSKLKLN